jgi:hypothetical protein
MACQIKMDVNVAGFANCMKLQAAKAKEEYENKLWEGFARIIHANTGTPTAAWPWSSPYFVLAKDIELMEQLLKSADYEKQNIRWLAGQQREMNDTLNVSYLTVNIMMDSPAQYEPPRRRSSSFTNFK